MISIITRAYNRLEYTIRTIQSVRQNTLPGVEYEHIIINNASKDGTKEWLDWIKSTDQEYFKRVKAFHMDTNLGDWEGMKKGLDFISPDSKYIVQLDNDIEIERGWLTYMKHVLDNTDYQLVMCKRTGVGAKMKANFVRDYVCGDKTLKVGKISKVVACFMAKRNPFFKIAKGIKGKGNKSVLGQKMRPCGKIVNVFCHHNICYKESGENKLVYERQSTWEKL